MSKTVDLPYEKAIEKVTEELKKEEFGVLTTIDVKETMKKKLNVDFKRYVILGACNPPLAYKALQAEEQLGLLLPCNVVVYEEGGKSVVSIFDPMVMANVVDNKEVQPIADEVRQRLDRVFAAV
ncbi:MAG: DUF302 domain-containing protein [Ignavibacteria bacterium]|nr:DUF302 domain-containing protein [Ignavibacteria bacterium]